tara:strand:- start:5 stop:118 length:114 start_codon:yes stop_codon:yes gene_type:complete
MSIILSPSIAQLQEVYGLEWIDYVEYADLEILTLETK